MSQTLSPQHDQQKKQIQPSWFKNTLLIVTGFTLGLLAPYLLHLSATLLSSFISLIQQPEMANAWQSIGGMIESVTALITSSAFIWGRFRKKKTKSPIESDPIKQSVKKENESTKQSVKDNP